MNTVLKHNAGEVRYEVFHDLDGFHNAISTSTAIEFETVEKKLDYIKRYQADEFDYYGVVKMKVCKCCCMWSQTDSLWGIEAATAQEALDVFIATCGTDK